MHFWTLTLFWLAESVQWIFEISACDVITADYTIIMSRTLEATGNHACLRALCKWRQKHDFHFFCSMYNKTIVRFGICDIQNNQGRGRVRVISRSLRLRLITLTSTLILLDITKTSSNNKFVTAVINHIFISFSAVKIYDLSYVHLQEMLRWRPLLCFTLSPILVFGFY